MFLQSKDPHPALQPLFAIVGLSPFNNNDVKQTFPVDVGSVEYNSWEEVWPIAPYRRTSDQSVC